jgi:hypothetical protein
MKEEVSEKEAQLVKLLFDRETEFIKQFLPGKKEQQSETSYILILRSWGEMFSNKIKASTDPEKILTKENLIKYIESYNF